MKKVFFVLALTLWVTQSLNAQVDDGDWLIDDDWIDQSNFNSFKQQADKKYTDFRDSINIRFAHELARQWQPVVLQEPVERPHKPEPKNPPLAPKPTGNRKPNTLLKKMPNPEIVIPAPKIYNPIKRVLPLPEIPDNPDETPFLFYGKELIIWIPQKNSISECQLASTKEKDISLMWENLTKVDFQSCINQLLAQQQADNLNDWAMYEMICKLVNGLFPDNNRQVIATVFLLNQMEYDAKIARLDSGLACLLSMDCMIYANPYIILGEKKYFLFAADNSQKKYRGDVYTYSISMYGSNLKFDMSIANTPSVPMSKFSKGYERTVNNNSAIVHVNKNLMDFYCNYPQVETSIYANAQVDSLMKDATEKWFRPMVKGKSNYEAVATLLHFIQFGFDYATDDEQFGYEKPFFPEENFYYPKNDCEDRSILFSFLVRYLLGLDVVLLDYPGHIATAVYFPEGNIGGDYYNINGRKYIVCDPTYIGADIGMAQPTYENVNAKIITLLPITSCN